MEPGTVARYHGMGVLAALLFLVPADLCAQREYRIGPPPAWVRTIQPDPTPAFFRPSALTPAVPTSI